MHAEPLSSSSDTIPTSTSDSSDQNTQATVSTEQPHRPPDSSRPAGRSASEYQTEARSNEPAESETESTSAEDRSPPPGPVPPDPEERRELEHRIADELEHGWEIEHDFGDRVVLINRTFGATGTHILIGIFTFWWTMGMGNILYAAYSYYGNSRRKTLRVNEAVHDSSEDPDETATRSTEESGAPATERPEGTAATEAHGDPKSKTETATSQSHSPSPPPTEAADPDTEVHPALLILVVGSLWLFGFYLLATMSFFASGFGLLLITAGTTLLPSVRRRLRDRKPVTVNGKTTTVEAHRVGFPPEPCVVCACEVESGIERTYREEYAFFGVPLLTTGKGSNVYCRECAALVEAPGQSPLEFSSEIEDSDGGAHSLTEGENEDTVATTADSDTVVTDLSTGPDPDRQCEDEKN